MQVRTSQTNPVFRSMIASQHNLLRINAKPRKPVAVAVVRGPAPLSTFTYLSDAFPRRQQPLLRAVVLAYVSGLVSFFKLKAELNEQGVMLSGPSALTTVINADLPLLRCAKPFSLLSLSNSRAKATHLTSRDRTLVRKAVEHPLFKDRYATLLKGRDLFDTNELEARIGRLLTSDMFQTYIGKFVYRKLRFLSYAGVSQEDCRNEVLAAVTLALYRAYPRFDCDLHMINVAKRAAHNAGINFIMHHSASTRSAFEKDENGKTKFRVEAITDERVLENLLADHQQDHAEAVTRSVSLDTLENSMKPRARRFMQILRGEYDDEYSQYLGERNDGAASVWPFEKTLRHACKYFGITPKQAQKFLQQLHSSLT